MTSSLLERAMQAGNPETNDYYDYKGFFEYAWSHAVITHELYDKGIEECNFTSFDWSNECIEAISNVYSNYTEIDIYNIYAPTCLGSTLAKGRNKPNGRIKRIPGGYAPCYSSYAAHYFNKIDVQKAFHVNIDELAGATVFWETCSNYPYHINTFSLLPVYQKLIKGGLKIWIYSGDADGDKILDRSS